MVQTFDILGLGAAAVDDLIYVSSYPPPDAKTEVRRWERQGGGLTATALVAASRLGSKCAYAGILGSDDLSEFVLKNFQTEGVDITHVIRQAQARPVHSLIIVDDQRHTRNIFCHLDGARGADPILPEEIIIRSARVLFVDHFGLEGMIRAARIARKAQIPIVADFESHRSPRLPELIELVDHLILPRDFATQLANETNPAIMTKKLWSASRRAVVITCGSEGCWYRTDSDPDSVFHQPAYSVQVVDSTGCGDVFHGAYASALARGLRVAECIRFASAAAAIKATRPGGQAGIPNQATVEAFLNTSKALDARSAQ